MMTQIKQLYFRVGIVSVLAIFGAGFTGLTNAQDATPAASTPAPTPTAQNAPPSQPATQAPATSASPQAPVIRAESKLVIVDAVVTDKKGNYVHDLKQSDFKVYEDNKEQQVSSFSSGVDAAIQANKSIKRYLVLFFDNA